LAAALAGVLVVTAGVSFDAVQSGAASTSDFHLGSPATTVLKTTLTNLFVASEKRTRTLSTSARVILDNGIYAPATRAPAGFRNPVIVDGPGHRAWAYAEFVPVAHSTLHDQVALQDGGNVAIFEASPTWHVVQIGVGMPTCVRSELSKFAPAPAVTLWLAQRCQ
jgi:hypothetical protein